MSDSPATQTAAEAATEAGAAIVRVTYRKSAIGYAHDQKATVAALGLRRIRQTVEHPDTPALRGLPPERIVGRKRAAQILGETAAVAEAV